jgi:hypothetical protein
VAYAEDEITLPRLSVPSLIEAERARADELHEDDVDAQRWLVQLELEPEQIVPLYRLGLARGAVVWRDGMEEWRPLLIMRELRQLLTERTRRARLRLTSLTSLDPRSAAAMEEPVLPLASIKKKSDPPPAPSSRSPLPVARSETAPLEARLVLAPKTAPSERAPAIDKDLALLMELSQRPARPHAVRFSEVVHVKEARASVPPPISPVSPVTPLALAAQVHPSQLLPAQPANGTYGARRLAPAPQKAGASPTLVAMTAVAAVLLTTLFFWFGPVRAARSAADQAEKVVMMLAPSSGDRAARPRAAAETPAPSEAAPSQQLASTIPVMSLSDLDSNSSSRSGAGRGRAARAGVDDDERPSSAAKASGGGSRGADRGAIASALASAAARASACGEDAKGSARAVVTFGNSGAVRSVSFESQLPAGVNRSCVYNAISRTRIRPFEGDAITVRKTIRF